MYCRVSTAHGYSERTVRPTKAASPCLPGLRSLPRYHPVGGRGWIGGAGRGGAGRGGAGRGRRDLERAPDEAVRRPGETDGVLVAVVCHLEPPRRRIVRHREVCALSQCCRSELVQSRAPRRRICACLLCLLFCLGALAPTDCSTVTDCGHSRQTHNGCASVPPALEDCTAMLCAMPLSDTPETHTSSDRNLTAGITSA